MRSIYIHNSGSISTNFIYKIFDTYLKVNGLHKDSTVSLAFVSATEIKKLNKKYRNKNKQTDVLSFSFVEKKPRVLLKKTAHDLGEVIICKEVAKKQAQEKRHSLKKELTVLIVHGLVHLLGYDHGTDKEAGEMEKVEKQIFNKLKF